MALPMKTMKASKTVMKKPVAMKAIMKKPGAMKAMKAMKVMKSKIAAGRLSKAMVYKGAREKTTGGLKASDIIRNKKGKFVSKKLSARGKSNPWAKATAAARKALGIKGFVAFNKGPEGKALYAKIKELMGR
mmetsp:Transcript_46998/g.135890  ORF Transcript_46998/g.135890 Transcript_46998/m.135890 type:complete len:132 (-) Transcript_46998:127-522(-)